MTLAFVLSEMGFSSRAKNMILNFWALFLKTYSWDCGILFPPSAYQINKILQWQYKFIRFMFWWCQIHQIRQGGGIPQRASTHKFSWNIYEVVLKSRDK